jgi:hypothetical protein
MPEMIYICPVCSVRVWPLEKGVVQKGRHLVHEACDKRVSKVNRFLQFFRRAEPLHIVPKNKRF